CDEFGAYCTGPGGAHGGEHAPWLQCNTSLTRHQGNLPDAPHESPAACRPAVGLADRRLLLDAPSIVGAAHHHRHAGRGDTPPGRTPDRRRSPSAAAACSPDCMAAAATGAGAQHSGADSAKRAATGSAATLQRTPGAQRAGPGATGCRVARPAPFVTATARQPGA